MFWLVFLSAFLLDQVSKLWAANQGLVVENQGIALGLFSQEISSTVIVFASLLFMIGLWRLLRADWGLYPVASGLFWAGAISNWLDRVLLGAVMDWLLLPVLEVKNNLADVAMSLAFIGLLIWKLKDYARDRNNS